MKSVKESVIRIVIADDHEFIRKGIVSYVHLLGPQYAVTGEAGDGQALLGLIRTAPPDLLILDLEMPVMNGFEVLRHIQSTPRYAGTRVIVLSAHYNEFYFRELLLLGAASYLPKNCTGEQFVLAVRSVVADGFYITPNVTRSVVEELVKANGTQHLLSEKILSEREIEVIRLLSDGYSRAEIAEKLSISVNTVKFHLRGIYRKTTLGTNAALIKYAIRVGISGVEDPFDPSL
jgi:DNA-binding NarL/FixJ family response regulator